MCVAQVARNFISEKARSRQSSPVRVYAGGRVAKRVKCFTFDTCHLAALQFGLVPPVGGETPCDCD